MNSLSDSPVHDDSFALMQRSIVVFIPYDHGTSISSKELAKFGDVHPIEVDLEANLRFIRPKNVAWTNWPLISDVQLELRRGLFPRVELPPSEDVLDCLAAQHCFILDLRYLHPEDRQHRAHAFARLALVQKMVGMEKPVFVRNPRQHEFIKLLNYDLAAEALGSLFFDSNYAANFDVIGHKIISKYAVNRVLTLDGVPTAWGGRVAAADMAAANWTDHGWTLFTLPIVLQYLFALREASRDQLQETYHAYKSYRKDVQFCAGERLRSNVWLGSGKYPGLQLTSEVFRKMLGGFWGLGFVEPSFSDEVMVLTTRGQAFLEAMHRTNDDPDCILRFLDPVTRTIPAESCGMVREWMLRFFRKMKQKSA